MITINVAEADDEERERRRINLHEPYRTLIGHFRHELAHYYWERLVSRSALLSHFRQLFGDETLPYPGALQQHYQQGPAPDWQTRFVSAYASAHPWEDWAETGAHYLHMMDTLETAAAFGVTLTRERSSSTPMPMQPRNLVLIERDFDRLVKDWMPLTCALNEFNRGMGLPDLYPFVLNSAVIEKLRFIHRVIQTAHQQSFQ